VYAGRYGHARGGTCDMPAAAPGGRTGGGHRRPGGHGARFPGPVSGRGL